MTWSPTQEEPPLSTEENSVEELDAAEHWLQGYLTGRDGRAPEKYLLEAGEKAGHTADALRRAAGRLSVDAATLSPGTKESRWWWLPGATYSAEDAQLVGMTRNTWPYGPNIDLNSRVRMVAWAKRYKLKPARSSAPLCLTWLEKGSCRGCGTPRGHNVFRLDHMSGWTRDGIPAVIVNHLYPFGDGTVRELVPVMESPALQVSVRGGGWYGHATIQVEVWNPAALNARPEPD